MPAQPSSEKPPGTPRLPDLWPNAVLTAFGATLIFAALRLFIPLFPNSGWPDAALLILTTTATVAALSKQLPVLNVIFAAGIAAGIGGMAHAVNDVTGFPFGMFEFTTALGPRLLGILPLAIPAFWAIAALNARGVARLALHRSRAHPQHGYRVIVLSVLLMILLRLALEPFAVGVKIWWTATPTPLLALISSTLLSLMLQIAMTPLLLDKFPVPRPPNYWPLFVWAGINALMLVAILSGNRPH